MYEFFVGTATTDAYAFARAGSDVIAGHAFAEDGDGAPANGWTDANAVSVTLGGTAQATGGSVGDRVYFKDVSSALWSCTCLLTQGGTEATPFA
jgi:fructose-specific component phosphotransferase system IIB-like protein